MMILNEYRTKLIKESQRLDLISQQNKRFEKIILEIVEDKNEKSTLTLINELGLIKKKDPNFEKEQKKIIELLYLYLGASQIDEMYQNLKSSANIPFEELQKKLNQLVGLESVKEQVNDLIVFNKIQQLREKEGLKRSKKTLHMAFL